MSHRWNPGTGRTIIVLAMLDTLAFALLIGAAVYVLEIVISPLGEPFRDARHFLVPPIKHALVVAAAVMLVASLACAGLCMSPFRAEVALRMGVRCAVRLPIMLVWVFFAIGLCFTMAVSSMSTLTGSNWSGLPPSKAITSAISVAALVCFFVLCPLAFVVASKYVKKPKAYMRHALETFCPSCGYDLVGLEDGSVCPECGQ